MEDRPSTPTAADPVIARMNAIESSGQYDRTEDGLRRSRQGLVGDVQMIVQVVQSGHQVHPLASETLFLFWNLETGKQRRLLVNGLGGVWMQTDRGAVKIGERNKYFNAVAAILRARAN